METAAEVVLVLGRWLAGGVLLLAGTSKLRAPSSMFLQAILDYELVPRRFAIVLAAVLPRLEIVLGASLLMGIGVGASASGAFVVVYVLTLAVVASLSRGKRNLCGCLGFTLDQVREVQWSLVTRNVVLLLVLTAVATGDDRFRVDAWLHTSLPSFRLHWLLALCAAMVVAAVVAALARARARATLIRQT